MKTDIAICSYAKDYEWCEYNIRSIVKFCSGFHSVTIIVPTSDVKLFSKLESKYSTPALPVLIKHYMVYPGHGFNHHQAMKCYADVFCPQADFILHTDSDCVFTAPTTPELFLKEGRPIIVKRSYESIKASSDGNSGAYWWKDQTERAVRFPVEYEFMQRHPAVHYSWLYSAFRKFVELNHCTPFTDYCLKQKETPLQGFSEFNALGAVAHMMFQDAYHWVDRDKDPLPPNTITQFWSWGGVNAKRAEIEKILNN